MVAVFTDFSDHCHSELLSPAVFSLVSAEESGKPCYLETEPEEECHYQAKTKDGPGGQSIHQEKLPEPSTDVSIQITSHTIALASSGSTSLSNAVTTQPRQTLLRIFSRERDRSAEVQSKLTEGLNTSKQKETHHTQEHYQGTADTTVDPSVSGKHEAKLSGMIGIETLQLAALQNTAFKETLTTVEADTQREATEGRVIHFPEKLSNLKAFWERENTGPKIIFTREEARQEDMAKARIEASRGPEMYVESMSNLSAQMEMTVEATAGRSQENSLSSQTECSLSVDLSKEDGTYRANPVIIYEETDESLTGSGTESQISDPHENINIPLPSSGIPVSLPRQSSSSPQGTKPAKISDLKHFWEKEYTGPRVIVARVRESSNTSALGNKEVSPQSDLKRYLDNREKSEGEEQTSPYRTKSSGVLKSLKVTDKGFVSPDRSQPRSSDSTVDVHSAYSQHQVKTETESKESPLSPTQSHTPRSKDQNDEVRRNPSKTCHPRVLPTESSSPKRSRVEGSPLKTFPIDINPQTKVNKEQQGKPTPMPRQRNSPSRELKQTVLRDTKYFADITSCPLPLHPEDTATYFSNPTPVNTQQNSSSSSTSQSKKSPEKKLRTFTQLARSFIPQDYQHYLGPQEKAHSPPFHQEKADAGEINAVHRPQSALRDFVGNQNDSLNEWNLPTVSSHIVQSKLTNSSQDTTTRAWFLSRASSDSELLLSLFIYVQDND